MHSARVSKSHPSNQPAFTLVELLAVIAVLALLATLPLLAMTSKDKLMVQQLRCTDNLKQLSMVWSMYISDTGSLPPRTTSLDPNYPNGEWMGALMNYKTFKKNTNLLPCPTASTPDPAPIASNSGGTNGAADHAYSRVTNPVNGAVTTFFCSYGNNGWFYVNASNPRQGAGDGTS